MLNATFGLSPSIPPIEVKSVADLVQELKDTQRALEATQPTMSAAVLAATAFRLKDQGALLSALRILVRAVAGHEQAQAVT